MEDSVSGRSQHVYVDRNKRKHNLRQGDCWHAADADMGGQSSPPCSAGCTTERERVCVPPPQERVHAVQLPQGDAEQWTGHGATSHGRDCDSAGQPNEPLCT